MILPNVQLNLLKHLAFFEDFYDSNNECVECTQSDYIYESDRTIDQESTENEIFLQNKQDSHLVKHWWQQKNKQQVIASKNVQKSKREKEKEHENKSENHGLLHILFLKHMRLMLY